MIANAHRLRRMTRDELAWRARGLVRTQAQRALVTIRRPGWDRRALGRALAADSIEPALRRAMDAEDWPAAHDALEEQLRRRLSRFVLDPAAADTLISHIQRRWPDAATEAAARADRLLAGSHDLLGYRDLRFSPSASEIDWHLDPVHGRRAPSLFWADVPFLDPACGDHKIIWELNRQQHLLQLGRALWLTGESRYGLAIVDRLESWLDANPPLVGINWASMLEIGLRSISWTWALHFLLGPSTPLRASAGAGSDRAPWLVDLIVGLDRQLAHIEQNLSYYFSPNTHLTGEALALYTVGLAVPEMAGSARWVALGREILQRESGRQIHPDGGHAEASTHYQRYTLDIYLCALLSAHRAGDAGGIASFGEVVTRLADFTRTMADDHGLLPLIGDDDGGMLWPIAGRPCRDVRDSLAVAACVLGRPGLAPWGMQEEVLWLASDFAEGRAEIGAEVDVPSRVFRDTGYIVARGRDGSHAVFDVGRHGYLNCGHAHADALAVTLGLAGRPLLVDPGTATYMDSGVRDQMRGSLSHNTVTIDGRPQSIPSGRFHWTTRADARLHASRHNPSFDWAEASHDGYAPVQHRRTLLRTAHAGWLLLDEILGDGSHEAEASWHFDPAWTVAADSPGSVLAVDQTGEAAWLLHDGGAASVDRGGDNGSGWYAPVYGVRMPAAVARVRWKGAAPFAMMTWIGTDRHGRPTLERVSCACDAGGRAVCARVTRGELASVFMIRPGEPDARGTRDARLPDYQTDARVLHYTTSGGRLRALDLVDASRAIAIHGGWLSVTADVTIPDLHVTIDEDTIDVRSSAPPASLMLEGDALLEGRTVRVNGLRSASSPISARAHL